MNSCAMTHCIFVPAKFICRYLTGKSVWNGGTYVWSCPCLSRGLIKCCIIIAYDLVPIFFVINDHILVPLLMGTMKFDSCFSPSVTKKATLDLLTPGLSASCPIWVLHILTDSWGIAEVFFFLRLFEAFLVKCFSSSLEVCGGNRLLHHCFVFSTITF